MIYQWKPDTRHKVDAQIAGEEMERIRVHNNGRLESRDLVEAARPESSPLHPEFEWDDRKAAEAWRVEQAGALIRHITVLVEQRNRDPAPVRAFVSVVRDTDRSYTSVAHALSDEELRQQVLRQALVELEGWRKRYGELVELAQVFAQIDLLTGPSDGGPIV